MRRLSSREGEAPAEPFGGTRVLGDRTRIPLSGSVGTSPSRASQFYREGEAPAEPLGGTRVLGDRTRVPLSGSVGTSPSRASQFYREGEAPAEPLGGTRLLGDRTRVPLSGSVGTSPSRASQFYREGEAPAEPLGGTRLLGDHIPSNRSGDRTRVPLSGSIGTSPSRIGHAPPPTSQTSTRAARTLTRGQHCCGFTLIEMLAAMVLLLLVFGVVMKLVGGLLPIQHGTIAQMELTNRLDQLTRQWKDDLREATAVDLTNPTPETPTLTTPVGPDRVTYSWKEPNLVRERHTLVGDKKLAEERYQLGEGTVTFEVLAAERIVRLTFTPRSQLSQVTNSSVVDESLLPTARPWRIDTTYLGVQPEVSP